MNLSISINQIKYVLALHETGSFSKAADLTYVTQSTLSTMVRKLENQMNLKLFDRKSKPIVLTAEGVILLPQLKLIHKEFENLQELVQDTSQEFYGTFRIGIIPTLAPFLLPLFLDKMINNHSNINFSIDEITTNDIVKKIKSRELDIGILSLPIENKELNQKSLFLEEFLIYDTFDKNKSSKKYKIKDIDVNRLWLLEESHCMTSQIEKICHLRKNRKLGKNLSYNSGSVLSLLELVKMNKGITLLPKLASLNQKLIDSNLLHLIEAPVPVREIGIVTHSNFAKKKLLTLLENSIMDGIKPILKNSRKVRIIKPNLAH